MAVFDKAGAVSREAFLDLACALAREGRVRIKNDKRTMLLIRLTLRVWLIEEQPPLVLVSDAGGWRTYDGLPLPGTKILISLAAPKLLP